MLRQESDTTSMQTQVCPVTAKQRDANHCESKSLATAEDALDIPAATASHVLIVHCHLSIHLTP
jgi:hypothetical protein